MINEIKDGYVKTDKEHGIVTIEFYHRQSNSLPGKLLDALAQAIHAEGINPQTKVIIVRSGGDGVFCSGASFDELASITNEKQGLDFFTGFGKVINAMRKAPKFIVVRVQGKSVGGGIGIIAAADYAIALEGSDVKLSELSVGIGPFVVGPVVERKIGLSSFSQLAIDSHMWRTGDWARQKGLFAELHPNIESMDESIRRLTNHLAASGMDAMSEMKRMFWKGTEHWDEFLKERAAISGKLILSKQSEDFIEKFKAKAKEKL
ncbi:MAG: enoyl-CoA hydratase/isomerase family protein [Chitinophagaceae bacterium]|nr:enoyl-CoA hydratase/isomerase family protein [Chitinophagaceae bacterium]